MAASTNGVPTPVAGAEPSESETLPKYKRDLAAKARVLRAELQALQPQTGHCRIEVYTCAPSTNILLELFSIQMLLNILSLPDVKMFVLGYWKNL